MKVQPQTAATDLKKEIQDLRGRFLKLEEHELFVLWFLRAYIAESEKQAASALTGAPRDKGVDAVFTDDQARMVFLVQAKFRKSLGGSYESRSDVMSFAQLAHTMWGDEEEFASLVKDLDTTVRMRLLSARDRLLDRHYRLKLYYVTMGKCSQNLSREAGRLVKKSSGNSDLEIIDDRRIPLILIDYLDGVAPPVPSLELEIETGPGTSTVLQQYDGKSMIDSWVFSMNGRAIADLYSRAGERLFARNIRGYLGSTEVNRSLEDTLENQPGFFWYYNNGITIICDDAEETRRAGRNLLYVTNPQIINGQQTTRQFYHKANESHRASVLVRVFKVPRDGVASTGFFEDFVRRIVTATNWQNKILASDLKSNDHRQIEIERELRKYGYYYLRKRRRKSEARAAAGRGTVIITKMELAQAVAACDLDPSIVRTEGKEGLFEDRFYPTIFPNRDPLFYLPRYWLMRHVAFVARGYPERAYAKWLVMHFVWGRLVSLLSPRTMAESFVNGSLRDTLSIVSLAKAINPVFAAALRFFRRNRGRGARAIDVSRFFMRRGLEKQFESFWKEPANRSRNVFKRAWTQFDTRLKDESGLP